MDVVRAGDFDFFKVGVRGLLLTEGPLADCADFRCDLLRPEEEFEVGNGNGVEIGGNKLDLCFSEESRESKRIELPLIGLFLASSLRARSRSLRTSISIRHSTAFFTSSKA